ncbi:MAG: hypothetical protein WD845_18160 [Pirellulales bacterium]
MTPEIEEFAKTLMQWARGAAIQSSDMTLRPMVNAPVAKRWKKAASEMAPEDFARVLIPDIVDDTVFHLLRAIDEGSLQLAYTASNGTVVDLTAEGLGELAGWYMGSDGWRAMYSNERFVDDFSDLHGEDVSGAES